MRCACGVPKRKARALVSSSLPFYVNFFSHPPNPRAWLSGASKRCSPQFRWRPTNFPSRSLVSDASPARRVRGLMCVNVGSRLARIEPWPLDVRFVCQNRRAAMQARGFAYKRARAGSVRENIDIIACDCDVLAACRKGRLVPWSQAPCPSM